MTSIRADLADQEAVDQTFADHEIHCVIHLAAQAGVRQACHARVITRIPIDGTLSVSEACQDNDTPHLTYASSSSVYGANAIMPFSEAHDVDHPLAIFAVPKRALELMAHSYSYPNGLPTTGLPFFTVYGPEAGRIWVCCHLHIEELLPANRSGFPSRYVWRQSLDEPAAQTLARLVAEDFVCITRSQVQGVLDAEKAAILPDTPGSSVAAPSGGHAR